jgi:uncharacterized protein
MDKNMIDFITSQKVASICCLTESGSPYCFSCFFAFDSERNLIYFKSTSKTSHSRMLYANAAVAGTIQPDKLNILAIKGIQFSGMALDPSHPLCSHADNIYHKRYPFALAMPGEVWAIEPDFIKLTDSSVGFGRKTTWERKAEEQTRASDK